jgi:DNA-binding CsgD family transcriptional regulator
MTELRRGDLLRILDVAATVRAVTATEDFGKAVLAPLRRLVTADSVTYNEIDTRRRRSVWAADPPDALEGVSQEAFERFLPQHPIVAYSKRTGDGQARTISDFLDRRQFHRTDLYATFFRPARVEHQVAITLAYGPSLIVGIAFNRSSSDFSARDRAVLDAVRTQLTSAYQATMAAETRACLLDAMDRALDDQGRGVLVVHPGGRLMAATPAAQRFLSNHLGVRVEVGQRLPGRLAALADAAPSRTRPVKLTGQGANLYASLLDEPGSPARVIVIDERAAGDTAPLAAAGLTHREINVLRLLAEGRSNAEIARQLGGASIRTVHKHLEHIYAKLGVHDRTAAATCWLRASAEI